MCQKNSPRPWICWCLCRQAIPAFNSHLIGIICACGGERTVLLSPEKGIKTVVHKSTIVILLWHQNTKGQKKNFCCLKIQTARFLFSLCNFFRFFSCAMRRGERSFDWFPFFLFFPLPPRPPLRTFFIPLCVAYFFTDPSQNKNRDGRRWNDEKRTT